MSNQLNTIQSLKTVDSWIDTINANINGGVRTGYKSSRLKFSGSNVDIQRVGTANSLPLQLPETGLSAANTVTDFSQGAITASTENTHLAVQGDGFFLVCDPASMDTSRGRLFGSLSAKFFLTRDGEFHTDANGLLVNNNGYFLCSVGTALDAGKTVLQYDSLTLKGTSTNIRGVYNDLDLTLPAATQQNAVKLSDFVAQTITNDIGASGTITAASTSSLLNVNLGQQSLAFSEFGSTVYDFGFLASTNATAGLANVSANIGVSLGSPSTSTVLSKSLEASNASMTQSVPELSLAQKLFSALTKVLQINSTNTDALLGLIR